MIFFFSGLKQRVVMFVLILYTVHVQTAKKPYHVQSLNIKNKVNIFISMLIKNMIIIIAKFI